MANFKVGQRVRIVGSHASPSIKHLVGKEGVVVSLHSFNEAFPISVKASDLWIALLPSEIAPLTDPDSDWADSSIRKLLEKCKQPLEIVL